MAASLTSFDDANLATLNQQLAQIANLQLQIKQLQQQVQRLLQHSFPTN